MGHDFLGGHSRKSSVGMGGDFVSHQGRIGVGLHTGSVFRPFPHPIERRSSIGSTLSKNGVSTGRVSAGFDVGRVEHPHCLHEDPGPLAAGPIDEARNVRTPTLDAEVGCLKQGEGLINGREDVYDGAEITRDGVIRWRSHKIRSRNGLLTISNRKIVLIGSQDQVIFPRFRKHSGSFIQGLTWDMKKFAGTVVLTFSLLGASVALAQNLTAPQKNAVRSARSYLDMTGFSRDGLIAQLSSPYGDRYSVADATAAVESLSVDWNREAAELARTYLGMMGFSCSGLIEQLSSAAGDKFTRAQATYGAQQAGAC